MSNSVTNLHASAVIVHGNGIIIFGKSGSGKTSLVLELIRQCARDGITAQLIADDRVTIERIEDQLVASAPASIAGLIEVRGSGIHAIDYEKSATLHLAVELVNAGKAERMAPLAPKPVAHGLALPVLILPENQIDGSIRAILSHLGLYFPLLIQKNVE